MQHVAILHNVVLAFLPEFPRFFCALLALAGDEIIIRHGFGANEAAFKIRMNHSGGLRCGAMAAHGPRAHFLDTRRKVRDEVQQGVTGADDPVQARFGEAQILQKRLGP